MPLGYGDLRLLVFIKTLRLQPSDYRRTIYADLQQIIRGMPATCPSDGFRAMNIQQPTILK